MARRVFFSFHYERDIWRASQVRNSWVTKPDRDAAVFWDAASWESVKRSGEEGIKRWINRQLDGTSVTIVLIGNETSTRKYVNEEIKQSFEKKNGLLAIYIHNQRDQNGSTDSKGANPIDNFIVTDQYTGSRVKMSKRYKTYDWIDDNGKDNIGDWIEKATVDVGR